MKLLTKSIDFFGVTGATHYTTRKEKNPRGLKQLGVAIATLAPFLEICVTLTHKLKSENRNCKFCTDEIDYIEHFFLDLWYYQFNLEKSRGICIFEI